MPQLKTTAPYRLVITLDTHEANEPVREGLRSVVVRDASDQRRTWVLGSNSTVPPPTRPSATPSVVPGRRSPVGVAEMDVVVLPRKIETTMSSSG
jgi:hypothetical protein